MSAHPNVVVTIAEVNGRKTVLDYHPSHDSVRLRSQEVVLGLISPSGRLLSGHDCGLNQTASVTEHTPLAMRNSG